MRRSGSGSSLLGVDITSSAVRLVELKRMADGMRLESVALCPLVEGAVVERRIHNPDDVVRALSQAVSQAGPSTRNTVVALPSSAIITKTIELPRVFGDDEIEAYITSHSDQHIPFAFHDTAFDFQRLGASAKEADCQDVLLVAGRHQDINLLLDIVTRSGLSGVAVDVESFAIERVLALPDQQPLPDQVEQGGVAYIDMEREAGTFHVLHKGRVTYHQSMSMTTDTPSSMAFDSDTLYSTEAVTEALDGVMAAQVARAMQLYSASHGQAGIDQILLAGDISLLGDLEQRLSGLSGQHTRVVDPFSGISINENICDQYLEAHAPALLTACGLAMKGCA